MCSGLFVNLVFGLGSADATILLADDTCCSAVLLVPTAADFDLLLCLLRVRGLRSVLELRSALGLRSVMGLPLFCLAPIESMRAAATGKLLTIVPLVSEAGDRMSRFRATLETTLLVGILACMRSAPLGLRCLVSAVDVTSASAARSPVSNELLGVNVKLRDDVIRLIFSGEFFRISCEYGDF